MAFPQLPGVATSISGDRAAVRVVAAAAAVFLIVVVVAVWRVKSQSAPLGASASTSSAIQVSVPPNPPRQLYLAHAKEELIRSAEQLVAARKLLAGLSPELARNYMTSQKRRLDRAWSLTNDAQRSIEQAIRDIEVPQSPEE